MRVVQTFVTEKQPPLTPTHRLQPLDEHVAKQSLPLPEDCSKSDPVERDVKHQL